MAEVMNPKRLAELEIQIMQVSIASEGLLENETHCIMVK